MTNTIIELTSIGEFALAKRIVSSYRDVKIRIFYNRFRYYDVGNLGAIKRDFSERELRDSSVDLLYKGVSIGYIDANRLADELYT